MAKNLFLPVTKEEMNERGWEALDFLLVSGDAYVDHPSFGVAIIGRLLESKGYRVGIIAQPDWRSVQDFKKLGRPRYAALISSGNLDSMVNHYTASKKPRSEDAYAPGGKAGLRPDRAAIVYAHRVKEAFKGLPVILGGVEASLRRFAHYDYWDNKVRRSVMVDAKADLLVYGMGEKPILNLAELFYQGTVKGKLSQIPGTAFLTPTLDGLKDYILLPSFEEVSTVKKQYAEAFKIQMDQQDPYRGKILVQAHGELFMVQNPPAKPLSQQELDNVYALPFQRTYHPSYATAGGVPALREVEFSLTSHRGCYGGCSFCALTFHQGRIIQNRSHRSLLTEAEKMTWQPNFKGYIHDVGGPTANFRNRACKPQETRGACSHRQCLFPEPCPSLEVSHEDYLSLLKKIRSLPKVKKVFVRSGIRYDYLLKDSSQEFFKELCQNHISGQLKVAPEHVSAKVLAAMGKPGGNTYDKFVQKYKTINRELGKEQYLVPYFMSSHPGSTLKEAIELAEYVRDLGYNPEQVQDFIPTPGSLSTCMFYTGLDPRTMEKIYVPRGPHEKAMQRALIQYRNPKNYELVYEALTKADRKDLIGFGPKALIRPKKTSAGESGYKGKNIGDKARFAVKKGKGESPQIAVKKGKKESHQKIGGKKFGKTTIGGKRKGRV